MGAWLSLIRHHGRDEVLNGFVSGLRLHPDGQLLRGT
jgi:hypothetical protein